MEFDYSITFEDILGLFPISRDELGYIYQDVIACSGLFRIEHWHDFVVKKKGIYRPIQAGAQRSYDRSHLVGIDLPLLVSRRGMQSKERIMVVGEDPLRNTRDFPNVNSKAVIGTPYAIHSRYYRENRTALYFKFFERILNFGHSIYLTDVYKVWAKYGDRKISVTGEDKKRFMTVLQNEITRIQPDYLITFGKSAGELVTRNIVLSDLCRHIALPHPSGAANGYWMRSGFVDNPTNEMKLDYMFSQLQEAGVRL